MGEWKQVPTPDTLANAEFQSLFLSRSSKAIFVDQNRIFSVDLADSFAREQAAVDAGRLVGMATAAKSDVVVFCLKSGSAEKKSNPFYFEVYGDFSSPNATHQFELSLSPECKFVLSGDGHHLAAVGKRVLKNDTELEIIHIYNLVEKKLVRDLQLEIPIKSLALNHNGSRIVIGSSGFGVIAETNSESELVKQIGSAGGSLEQVAFSPDGRFAAWGCENNRPRRSVVH